MTDESSSINKKIFLFHIALFLLLAANFLLFLSTEITVTYQLLPFLKMAMYSSAFYLFFVYRKPFTFKTFYFSMYVLYPVLIVATLFLRSVGLFLFTLFTFFFFPQNIKIVSGDYTIYSKFQGFLGACCQYEVYENHYYLFERKVGEFPFEESLPENTILKVNGKKASFDFKYELYNYDAKKTTVIDSTFQFNIR